MKMKEHDVSLTIKRNYKLFVVVITNAFSARKFTDMDPRSSRQFSTDSPAYFLSEEPRSFVTASSTQTVTRYQNPQKEHSKIEIDAIRKIQG
jgi:hypothetical protein